MCNVYVCQSEELKARLRKLAERAEREEYRELVKDIMPKNDTTEPFSSYKDQLGFGNFFLFLSNDPFHVKSKISALVSVV